MASAFDTEWWTWESPNGVDHLVPGDRPCATCGRHHDPEENIVNAIADDIIGLADGDTNKALAIAAVCLSNEAAL